MCRFFGELNSERWNGIRMEQRSNYCFDCRECNRKLYSKHHECCWMYKFRFNGNNSGDTNGSEYRCEWTNVLLCRTKRYLDGKYRCFILMVDRSNNGIDYRFNNK